MNIGHWTAKFFCHPPNLSRRSIRAGVRAIFCLTLAFVFLTIRINALEEWKAKQQLHPQSQQSSPVPTSCD
jgi:hypothetical protein